MAKSRARPGGNKRPSNRQRARGGVGPPPAYRPSSTGGGTTHGGDTCCPMVAAVRSLRRGHPRLAARYARLSVRLILAWVA